MQRRTFLKTTAVAALGTASIGQASADTVGRFVVDRKSLRNENDLEIVHDIDPVDLLVVRATESTLNDQRADYAPDISFAAREYEPVQRAAHPTPSAATDLYEYQWDKQDQGVKEAHETTRGEGTRVAIIDSGVASNHPDLQGQVNLDDSKSFADDDYGVGELSLIHI